MAGLFIVKGRMVRIAVSHFAAESRIIQVVPCMYKKNKRYKKYLQDRCTKRRRMAKKLDFRDNDGSFTP